MMPLYLCHRDVLHSPALWPRDVLALERMWNLPRFPVDPRPMDLATWERGR
jgi:hypothetical protein